MRPIKKKFFSNDNAGADLRFKAYINGSANTTAYVISQRGTKKYKLTTTGGINDVTTSDCYLVNKAGANLLAGEASMVVTPYVGNVGFASKITEHRVTTFASTTQGGAVTLTLTNSGTGGLHPYVAGDTITVAGGTGAGCIVTVDTVDGSGLILTFHVSTAGTSYLVGDHLTQGSTTSAAGTGATFDVATVYAAAASYKWSLTPAAVAGEADLVLA